MRLSRLTKLVIALSMVAAAAPATAAAAPGTPGARPDSPGRSGELPAAAAERALEAVQAAFSNQAASTPGRSGDGHRGEELTQDLLQLRLGFDDLSPEDQRTASAFLARPTEGTEYYGANYTRRARPTHDCRPRFRTAGSNICVHWARRTSDAPPRGDRDGDRIPNQVEKTRDLMNLVWGRIVDAGRYKAPLKDRNGPNGKLDVYLVDIGGDGLYGYCGAEPVGKGRAAAAYCVLDDDYAKKQFPGNTPLGNLRVTGAHEFFHAVQFAYDVREDPWLMESTATWVEDEIFDNVNDNRYYLSRSVLAAPHRPLDSNALFYGNWIWWRYLTERFPAEDGTGLPTLVREVWQRADNSTSEGTYSMEALSRELAQRGQRLATVFADFSTQNRLPHDPTTGIYEEGRAYRKAPLAARFNLDAKDRPQVARKSPELPHLSSATVAFVPKSGYAGDWTLDLDLNLPSRAHEPGAQVTVFGTDGSVQRTTVGLNSKGIGSVQVDFGKATVRRVELTLVNGDHSYDCFQGTQWSCHGVPDPKRPFHFSASTWRPVP